MSNRLLKIDNTTNAYDAINPEPNFRKKPKKHFRQVFRFKRYWPLLFVPFAFWLGNNFRLVINQTDSLPQKVWILSLNKTPKKYDYIAFKAHQQSGISPNVILHKQVLGVEGDVITIQQRDFFINGRYVATAKTHSLKNEPLKLGQIGTLQKGQYYVSTPHKDSFDSRYDKMGWIDRDHILGVLYPLF